MKVSEAELALRQLAHDSAKDWINGNLKEAIERIYELPAKIASHVTHSVASRLDADSRAMFYRRIESEAVSDMMTFNKRS